MGNSRFSRRGYRLVARLHGDRLWLASDLRRMFVAEMVSRAGSLSGCSIRAHARVSATGVEADQRAFARSVDFERLAAFQLFVGHPVAAYGSLCRAALEALCGEEYDHGDMSLPARFLRIRFYHLWDRILALWASEPLLRDTAIDRQLLWEARRLGEEWL